MPLPTRVCFFASLFAAFQGMAAPETIYPPLQLITEHNPPAEYVNQEGEVSGVTVALITLLMQQLNEQGQFIVMPWSRGLLHARTHENVMLFETVKTAQRESWFKWVGPLKRYDIRFFARADKADTDFMPEHLIRKNVACSYRNAAIVENIKKLGFNEKSNLVLTAKSGECIEMLRLGRVDLITLSDLMVDEVLTQLSAENITLKPVMYLTERQLYLAFSPDISDQRVARWQQALEQSYRDGSMRKLYQGVYSESLINRLEKSVRQ